MHIGDIHHSRSLRPLHISLKRDSTIADPFLPTSSMACEDPYFVIDITVLYKAAYNAESYDKHATIRYQGQNLKISYMYARSISIFSIGGSSSPGAPSKGIDGIIRHPTPLQLLPLVPTSGTTTNSDETLVG